MHLAAGPGGRVRSAGRTAVKILGCDPRGLPLGDLVELRRPARADTLPALRECAGASLRLTLRPPGPTVVPLGECAAARAGAGHDPRAGAGDPDAEPIRLVGVAAEAGDGGILLNLSFGIGLRDAVARWSLTMDDFAPTDLAAELLYLSEANAAALSEARDLAERLDRAHEAARREAATDPLTGLANRRALERTAERLGAEGLPFALLSIDLDRFKAVNDRWGHAAGDAVLTAIGRRLRQAARRDDLAARLGGDEFALLLRGDAPEERLLAIAADLIRAIEQPIPVPAAMPAAMPADDAGGAPVTAVTAVAQVSASVGVARSADHLFPSADALLRAADAPLYAAKHAGRGRALGCG